MKKILCSFLLLLPISALGADRHIGKIQTILPYLPQGWVYAQIGIHTNPQDEQARRICLEGFLTRPTTYMPITSYRSWHS